MAITVGKTNFKSGGAPKLPTDLYNGRLVAIVDLGCQPGNPDAKFPAQRQPTQKISLIFDLVDHYNEETKKPHLISADVSAFLGDRSSLSKAVSAIVKKETKAEVLANLVDNPVDILGKPLQLSVELKTSKNGNEYNSIAAYSPLPKGFEPKETQQELFNFFPMQPDMDTWTRLISYYTKRKIMESLDNPAYPKELHQQWVADEEQWAKDHPEDGVRSSASAKPTIADTEKFKDAGIQ